MSQDTVNVHDRKVGNRLGRSSQSRVDPDSSSISPAPRLVDFDLAPELTHQHLDKSTSTYFRLIIIVFISRRRLIPPLNECSTKKAPGYVLDVDLFRLIRLIFMSQIDLSLLDTNSRQRRISNLSIVGEDSMLEEKRREISC